MYLRGAAGPLWYILCPADGPLRSLQEIGRLKKLFAPKKKFNVDTSSRPPGLPAFQTVGAIPTAPPLLQDGEMERPSLAGSSKRNSGLLGNGLDSAEAVAEAKAVRAAAAMQELENRDPVRRAEAAAFHVECQLLAVPVQAHF